MRKKPPRRDKDGEGAKRYHPQMTQIDAVTDRSGSFICAHLRHLRIESSFCRFCLSGSNVIGLALRMLCLLTVGCAAAGHPVSESGPTVVRLWSGWTGAEGRAFQGIVAAFNRTHPGIRVENLGGVQDDTKTIRAITAGVPPDLFFLWDPANLGPLASMGALLPLDNRFGRAGLRPEWFVPASLAFCRSRGRLYALPYLLDAEALFWNKRVFREAGLDPERPPETLEALAALAERLTVRDSAGQIRRLGMQLPDILLICTAHGGSFYDEPQGLLTADSPANVRAFTWYRDLADRQGGGVLVSAFQSSFETSTGQLQGASHPFFTGKMAMMVSGEWMPVWIERYAPDLEYGIAPFPARREMPELRAPTQIGGNPACIPRESRHPDAAWTFLAWMQTRAAQIAFAQAINNVPNIRSLLTVPELVAGSKRKRMYGKVLRIAGSPNARAFPSIPVSNFYLREINNARDFVLHGAKTPEQALHDAQHRVLREWQRVEGPGKAQSAKHKAQSLGRRRAARCVPRFALCALRFALCAGAKRP
jgi:multiple sugar transport system substrate-binding protein